jgi:Na+/proline symporter
MDNAYLGEGLLGLVCVFMGVLFGLTWLVASRREGGRGFVAGAIPGVAFGAAIVVFGATRMFVPPTLPAVELFLFIVGAALTVALSRVSGQSGNPPGLTGR